MTSFKDVIGQKDVMSYIYNAVSTGQISHAYIVNGERGSGKKLIASLFAAALLCESEGPEPCNKCHSCIQSDSGLRLAPPAASLSSIQSLLVSVHRY